MPLRNLVILFVTTTIAYACYVRGGQDPYARYIAGGLLTIKKGALEPIDGRELFDGAMQGMVDVLVRSGDEHSQYLPADEADPLRSEIRQEFGGIGVRIRLAGNPPRLTIAGPPDPGTPAARANLLPGDHIQAIDGEPTDGMNMLDVLNHMRGRPGTRVRLIIERNDDNERFVVNLVREVIQIRSILGDVANADGTWQFRLADEPRIAHIRIVLFGDRTADELSEVLETLVEEGVEGVALDLRDNSGGVLDAAVAVCDMFLPAGRTVVETRGKNGTLLRRYTTAGNGSFLDLPLAAVVNQNSASAAEIVAACLQDHRRAIVVGERTYGKGTVQQVIPIGSNSLLKLTWASFWRPGGANIHRAVGAAADDRWGVVPDAGYERRLSQEEYAAYRKYRAQRDGSATSPPDMVETENGALPKSEFVDEQFELAVDYLRDELKGSGL